MAENENTTEEMGNDPIPMFTMSDPVSISAEALLLYCSSVDSSDITCSMIYTVIL